MLKSNLFSVGYNAVADNTGRPIFIRLAAVGSQNCKIAREFEVIAGQGHRSWCQSKALVRLPINIRY